MNHIDFAQVLSAALTPITLISGVGLLLLTMSARYAHTTGRVRQLLRTRNLIGNNDPKLNHAIELIFMRAALLKKAILLVVLSAGFSCWQALLKRCSARPLKPSKAFFFWALWVLS